MTTLTTTQLQAWVARPATGGEWSYLLGACGDSWWAGQ